MHETNQTQNLKPLAATSVLDTPSPIERISYTFKTQPTSLTSQRPLRRLNKGLTSLYQDRWPNLGRCQKPARAGRLMLDKARAAAMSDPILNTQFGRPWTGPPPLNRKGPGRDTQASFGNLNLNTSAGYTAFETAAARSMQSVRGPRVAEIERRARLMDAVGLRNASLRLGLIAASIRREVLA